MITFEELKARLSRDLAELRQLQESRFTTIAKRHIKEQEIGRLCYQAEEDLGTLVLKTAAPSLPLISPPAPLSHTSMAICITCPTSV